jgi:hypothetical protein
MNQIEYPFKSERLANKCNKRLLLCEKISIDILISERIPQLYAEQKEMENKFVK